MQEAKRRKLNKILNFYIGVGIVLGVLSILILFTPAVPWVMYKAYPAATSNEYKSLTKNIKGDVTAYLNTLSDDAKQAYLSGKEKTDYTISGNQDPDWSIIDDGKKEPQDGTNTGNNDESDKDYNNDTQDEQQLPQRAPLPPFDENLTATNTIIIPSIGVNSPIEVGEDSKAALQ